MIDNVHVWKKDKERDVQNKEHNPKKIKKWDESLSR